MEIVTFLQALSAGFGVAMGTINVSQRVIELIRARLRNARAAEVLKFLHDLGCLNEADVHKLIEGWAPKAKLTPDQCDELATLLTNLIRGARFHTTCGTPISSFFHCERLIEQLLANIQPYRRRDEKVGPGREEWVLKQFLGMGAFGEVWLGRNDLFPEPRAFKFFTREGSKEWLKREQAVLFKIKRDLRGHPNIIEFEDVVVEGQKWPFLVLEYVAGGSLEDWIVAHPQDRKPLNTREIMEGIARGLARAHEQKIYHHDLKPANVLLTDGSDVQAKIADFGLGTVEQGQGVAGSVYSSKMVVIGTQMYLPPEANDPYEPRSPAQDDVFAYGVIWYQMLVGKLERPPYDFQDQLRQHGIDSATIQLVARCLAQPSRRYEDAEELRENLENSLPPDWNVPDGCYDVSRLAAEYLHSQTI